MKNTDAYQQISDALAQLRQMHDTDPDSVGTALAEDLYGFAAYLQNDAGTARFRAMSAAELAEIFTAAARRFAERSDELGMLCGSLAVTAAQCVFESEASHDAYRQYLLRRSKELAELFAAMKNTPESVLLDPAFAEPCIKTIRSIFPAYETALAVYNKEAGFTAKSYSPMDIPTAPAAAETKQTETKADDPPHMPRQTTAPDPRAVQTKQRRMRPESPKPDSGKKPADEGIRHTGSAPAEHRGTPLPESFTASARRISETEFEIAWDIAQPDIGIRVTADGRVHAETAADQQPVRITLPPEARCEVCVEAYTDGKWIPCSAPLTLDTYTALTISRQDTHMRERAVQTGGRMSYHMDLRIVLSSPIPPHVSGFYYTVRDEHSEVCWPEQDAIGQAADIRYVSAENVRQQRAILCQRTVQNESKFYISVFTVYEQDGEPFITGASRIKLNRPVEVNLFWKIGYWRRKKKLLLEIELESNCPLEYVPAWVLCFSNEKYITSYSDSHAQIICDKAEMVFDSPAVYMNWSFPIETELPLQMLKKGRFFLFVRDVPQGDRITVRWKQGFFGEIKAVRV